MDEFDVYLDFSLQARSRFEAITSVLDNAAQDWISPKTFGGRGRRVTGGHYLRKNCNFRRR
jgi:hypothetical protein